jgi:hypothetical protein
MMHTFRLLGDFFHVLSVILFLVIVGIKGNGAGISLKTQYIFFLVFLLRYLDIFTEFYSWYNTLMKLFFILATTGIIGILKRVEPAKSTYSPTQDSANHWNLIMIGAIAGMVIHLVGSGVVNIRGSSGQEFEVHFEHYRCVRSVVQFMTVFGKRAVDPYSSFSFLQLDVIFLDVFGMPRAASDDSSVVHVSKESIIGTWCPRGNGFHGPLSAVLFDLLGVPSSYSGGVPAPLFTVRLWSSSVFDLHRFLHVSLEVSGMGQWHAYSGCGFVWRPQWLGHSSLTLSLPILCRDPQCLHALVFE